jgi:hypothetical protein
MACKKLTLSNQDDVVKIYVKIAGTPPFRNGNYTFTLVATDPNFGVAPLTISVPIRFGTGTSFVESQQLLATNPYNNKGYVAGEERPDYALSGTATGDVTHGNLRKVEIVTYGSGLTGHNVGGGKVSPGITNKLKEVIDGNFDTCSPGDPTKPSSSTEISVSFAVKSGSLPADAGVAILDPTITASLCGEAIGKECGPGAGAPFEKYITVLFYPPPAVASEEGNDWSDWLDDWISGGGGSSGEIDPSGGGSPNGGLIYPGAGGIGGSTPPPQPVGPIIVAEPNPLVFENTDVGTVRKKTFRLINLGDQPATITSMYSTLLSEPFYFGFGIPYPFELLPNQSITGEAIFSPPTADVFEDFSQVTMDLEGADVVTCEMLVTGTGTVAGDPGEPKFKGIALTGDNDQTSDLNFGNTELNQPKEGFIRVTNTGNDPDGLTISDATIIGTDAVQFSTAIPGGSLNIPVASAVDIQVIYDPQATGDHTSQFRITSDADQGQDDPINGYNYANVFGTGTLFVPTRTLEIDGGSNFGEVIAESDPKDLAITMTNNGNSPLLIRGIFSQDPFTLNLESLGQGVITPTVIEQGAVNGVVYPRVYQYVFPTIYSLEGNGTTSPGITITFSPPSVATYSGKIFFDISSSTPLTFGDDEWNVSGVGTFAPLPPIEPEPEPEPDPEPGPDPGVDPPPNPLSPTCIERQCEIPYIYDYSVNEDNLA